MRNRFGPNICLLILIPCLGALSVCAICAADEPTVSSVSFVNPAEGQTVSGNLRVLVRIEPSDAVPPSVVVGFGQAPWSTLQQVGETNDWAATIDTTLLPNGPATLSAYVPRPGWGGTGAARVECVLANELRWYFGDLHSHTMYSDGQQLPADAYAYARNVARLDFFCLTDHLELLDPQEWADIRIQAHKAHQDGVFVAFAGLEWTKSEGHACLYDPPTTRWPSDIAGLYEAVVREGTLAKFNHIGYPDDDVFDKLAYDEAADSAFQLIEVRMDYEQEHFIRALDLGWHVAPDGSSDTHSPNWGNAGTWTAIVAPGLSLRNVLEALRARRCYSTQDRNCQLLIRANDALMGEVSGEPAREVRVVVDVNDPDVGDTIARIELYEDGKVVRSTEPGETASRWEVALQPPPGKHYYFATVLQTDGQKMWSAPVWVTVAQRSP